jgi:hypothetical protein
MSYLNQLVNCSSCVESNSEAPLLHSVKSTSMYVD